MKRKVDSLSIVDDLLLGNKSKMTSKDPSTRVNIKNVISDAPVHAECVLPKWLTISEDLAIVRKKESDEDKASIVVPCPLFITGKLVNPKTNEESVQLSWIRDGSWKFITVERIYICSTSQIVKLSNYGFPVTSDSTKEIISYLRLYELENSSLIPITEITSQLGWNKNKSCFIIGDECIVPNNATAPNGINTKSNLFSNKSIIFKPKDQGENQIVASMHTNGSYDEWVKVINQLYDFPVVIFTVYTALTTPFMEVFECENFSYEISSPTSTGKTNALQIAASCWGKPSESTGGFFRTWKTTQTAIERAAQTLNGIPLILDDTKNAPGHDKFNKATTPFVIETIYMFSTGSGKARGTIAGTAENIPFKSIMMSSGESPSIDLTNNGGSRGRIISLWGLPFRDQSESLNKFISKISNTFKNNYGHAGKRVASFILNNKNHWSIWKEAYQEVIDKLKSKPNLNSAQMRIIQDIAAIVTAIPLIHAALPELRRDFKLENLITEILDNSMKEISIADNGTRFIKFLSEYLMENEQDIWTKEKICTRVSIEPTPIRIYSDYDGAHWSFIGIKSDVLKQIMKENKMDQNEVLRTLRSKNLIRLTGNEHSYQNQIIINKSSGSQTKTNMYCIKREAFESLSIFSW